MEKYETDVQPKTDQITARNQQLEFTDTNPITGPHKGSGVRVSGKRERTPEILDVEEMQLLPASLEVRERAMVFLDMGCAEVSWPASNGRMWISSICISM